MVSTHHRDKDFGHAFAITLGRMTNTSPKKAGGFTGTIYLASQGPGFRAEARRRTWTSPTTATDLSAGLAAQPMTEAVNDWALGVTGGGALNFEGLAVTGRANLMHGELGTSAGLVAGARVGGKTGTAAAGLFVAGVAALIILIAGASS